MLSPEVHGSAVPSSTDLRVHMNRSTSKEQQTLPRVEVSSSSSLQSHHYVSQSSSSLSPKPPIVAAISDTLPQSAMSAPQSPSRKGVSIKEPKEKTVSKTVSTFFKSLFSKTSSDGASDGASTSAAPPAASSKSFSAGKALSMKTKQPKATPASTHGQEPSSPTVHKGYHHTDISSPMHSSQSVTTMKKPSSMSVPAHQQQQPSRSPTGAAPAKEAPPSTLLAVSPVLPPNMAREVWCLKDYAIVEKMYTGYASTVYKAWCKSSGETVCLKVR